MKRIIVAATAVFALAACQTSWRQNEVGLTYKIFPGKGGDSLQRENFVKFNIAFTIPDKKTQFLAQLSEKHLVTSRSIQAGVPNIPFMEVMSQCMVGDSAVVVLSIDR